MGERPEGVEQMEALLQTLKEDPDFSLEKRISAKIQAQRWKMLRALRKRLYQKHSLDREILEESVVGIADEFMKYERERRQPAINQLKEVAEQKPGGNPESLQEMFEKHLAEDRREKIEFLQEEAHKWIAIAKRYQRPSLLQRCIDWCSSFF